MVETRGSARKKRLEAEASFDTTPIKFNITEERCSPAHAPSPIQPLDEVALLQARRSSHYGLTVKEWKLVAGDALVTALWVLISSTFVELVEYLHETSGVGKVALNLAVLVVALIAFGPLCAYFGGSNFNPVHNAAFIVTRNGSFTLNAARMAAQLAGAVAGSVLAVAALPPWLQRQFHTLPGGLKPGIALETGFVAEFLLGVLLNLVLLSCVDVRNCRIAYWLPLCSAVVLNLIGLPFTGPCLNPFISFAWYWHYAGHDAAVHWAVFWAAPFLGAVAAGLLHRVYWHKLQEARLQPDQEPASAVAGRPSKKEL